MTGLPDEAVSVVAVLHPDPARREDAMAAIQAALAGIRAEHGCELYTPHHADDGTFVVIERWSSRAALAAHDVGPAVQVLRDGLRGLTTAPTGVTVAVAF